MWTSSRTSKSTCAGKGAPPRDRSAVDGLLGVRYFRFGDKLSFTAAHDPTDLTYGDDTIHLDDAVVNNLLGIQVGGKLAYHGAGQLTFYATPKFGFYDNLAEINYNLYATAPNGVYRQAASTAAGTPDYPVHSNTNSFAFLSELDLGFDWQITPRINAGMGYRILGTRALPWPTASFCTRRATRRPPPRSTRAAASSCTAPTPG